MPATLSTNIDLISQKLIESTRKHALPLSLFGGEFTDSRLSCGQTAIAHIVSPGTSQVTDCCPTDGWDFSGGASAADRIKDVPIVMDKMISSRISLTKCAMEKGNAAYIDRIIEEEAAAIGKGLIDHLLGQVTVANFPQEAAGEIPRSVDLATIEDFDKDALTKATGNLNKLGARGMEYNGIVSTDAFNALDNDPFLASADYAGQLMRGEKYASLQNVARVRNIIEYPFLPDNGENLHGVIMGRNAINWATALPNRSNELANQLGIPATNRYEVMTDPVTGLSMLCVLGKDAKTDEIFMWFGMMVGTVIGGDDFSGELQRITAAS